jgi:hypothetical protein
MRAGVDPDSVDAGNYIDSEFVARDAGALLRPNECVSDPPQPRKRIS